MVASAGGYATLRGVPPNSPAGCFPAYRLVCTRRLRACVPPAFGREAPLSTLLGVAVCLPVSAVKADASQRKPATSRRATPARDPTYSATTATARKTRLARACASVRARERPVSAACRRSRTR